MVDVASGAIETTATPAGPVVVALLGEHDLRTKDRLLEELTAIVTDRSLVIDVARATFIDSSVLHVLVDVDRQAAAQGTGLVLHVDADQPAAKVLEASGLLGHLRWASTIEQAIELAR